MRPGGLVVMDCQCWLLRKDGSHARGRNKPISWPGILHGVASSKVPSRVRGAYQERASDCVRSQGNATLALGRTKRLTPRGYGAVKNLQPRGPRGEEGGMAPGPPRSWA